MDSVRGPGGGYSLARLARNVTVADIIFAVDEPGCHQLWWQARLYQRQRRQAGQCMTHELWATLNRKMVDYLDSVSLQDLVDQQRVRQLQEANNQAQACAVRVNRVVARTPPTRRPRPSPPTPPHKQHQEFVEMTTRPIYLDYSATTPVDPRVVDKMVPWLYENFGNPASRSHAFGWESEDAVERAARKSPSW